MEKRSNFPSQLFKLKMLTITTPEIQDSAELFPRSTLLLLVKTYLLMGGFSGIHSGTDFPTVFRDFWINGGQGLAVCLVF